MKYGLYHYIMSDSSTTNIMALVKVFSVEVHYQYNCKKKARI